jgi:hypothetical protein
MRLKAVECGHRFPQRIRLALITLAVRHRAPDIARTMSYRPELLGRAMRAWTQAVMRGQSDWSVGERELFAALTSKLNRCLF